MILMSIHKISTVELGSDTYEAKIAKIGNFCTFLPVIQLLPIQV